MYKIEYYNKSMILSRTFFKAYIITILWKGGPLTVEGKYTKTLKVRIDPELYDQVKDEAKKLGTDLSTYVRWCIQTGLYLEDLNSFIRSKSGEIFK
jgi:hypothetical protein